MSVHTRLAKLSGSAEFSKLREILDIRPGMSQMYDSLRAIPTRMRNSLNATPAVPAAPVVSGAPVNPTQAINASSSLAGTAKDLTKEQIKSNLLWGTGLAGGIGVATASGLKRSPSNKNSNQ